MRPFLKTTETFAPGSLSLPGRYYTGEDVFAAEREAIFAKSWTFVGRAEDIENEGDFFLTRIADESVIVLRDHDGKYGALRAVGCHERHHRGAHAGRGAARQRGRRAVPTERPAGVSRPPADSQRGPPAPRTHDLRRLLQRGSSHQGLGQR